ncbi:hypothetical protein [Nodularia spumigena]|uniref:hypothetical protein n=1 Tax=Nodularia spumigena TaxID=70799 RepID=UPI002B21EDAF|nr:hypothetical protein [Nodularia spumigena]MEA5557655.1 hypothetical protein [Nodularia spumigena CH309]
MKTHRFVSVCVAGAFATSAFAFVPWSNPNGSTANFNWSGGGSDNGLFGSPTVTGNTFIFTPSNFRAESDAGNGNGLHITDDRLEFTIDMKPGFKFDGIRIREFGDYAVFGIDSYVVVTGTLFVYDLDGTNIYQDDLVTTPGSPILSGFGAWSGVAEVDTSTVAPAISRVRVVLDNNLIAFSRAGQGGSFIEKKFTDAGIRIDIIPAPGALVLVGMGGLVATRRRR